MTIHIEGKRAIGRLRLLLPVRIRRRRARRAAGGRTVRREESVAPSGGFVGQIKVTPSHGRWARPSP